LAITQDGKATIVLLPQRQHHTLAIATREADLWEVGYFARAVDQHPLPLRAAEDMDGNTIVKDREPMACPIDDLDPHLVVTLDSVLHG
jgi:hypothetical protein